MGRFLFEFVVFFYFTRSYALGSSFDWGRGFSSVLWAAPRDSGWHGGRGMGGGNGDI
jgi:hypothetical protein